jgi:signal transduction histidine kinase
MSVYDFRIRGVREAVDQGENLARTAGLEFAADLPNARSSVQADSNSLRRALLILIDNAVKYTPRGGSVRVNLDAGRQFGLISVSDMGIGIARADVPHIFDRFWRADKARSREQARAGLGLSIAKWIRGKRTGKRFYIQGAGAARPRTEWGLQVRA